MLCYICLCFPYATLFPSKSSGRVQSTVSHPGTAGVCNYSLLARCKPEPGFYPVWIQSRTQKHPIALFCPRWVDKLQYGIAPAACVPKRLKALLGMNMFLGHPSSVPEPAVQHQARAPLSPAEEPCWAHVLVEHPCYACSVAPVPVLMDTAPLSLSVVSLKF